MSYNLFSFVTKDFSLKNKKKERKSKCDDLEIIPKTLFFFITFKNHKRKYTKQKNKLKISFFLAEPSLKLIFPPRVPNTLKIQVDSNFLFSKSHIFSQAAHHGCSFASLSSFESLSLLRLGVSDSLVDRKDGACGLVF